MKKTYADLCLERAEKATQEPWEIRYAFGSQHLPVSIVHGDNSQTVLDLSSSVADVEFIAHARQDVPELARRLKKACETLNDLRVLTEGRFGSINSFSEFIELLERVPEDWK